jgi:hypothetical protein
VKGKNRRKIKDNLRIIHKKSQTYNKYYSEFIQVSNVCNATATVVLVLDGSFASPRLYSDLSYLKSIYIEKKIFLIELSLINNVCHHYLIEADGCVMVDLIKTCFSLFL